MGGTVVVKPEQAAVAGTIVALGDSLTAGYGVKEKEAYPARLERKLHEAGLNWRVINAGISGETSRGTLERINTVTALKPQIVILEIGVNDAFQGIDPLMTRKCIDLTVRILKEHDIKVVLAGMRLPADAGSARGEAFADIYPYIASKHELSLIPFFLEGVAGDPSLNRADGIHPVAKGYRIVTETVYPYAVQAIESRSH